MTAGQGLISDCRFIKCGNASQSRSGGVTPRAFPNAGHPFIKSATCEPGGSPGGAQRALSLCLEGSEGR